VLTGSTYKLVGKCRSRGVPKFDPLVGIGGTSLLEIIIMFGGEFGTFRFTTRFIKYALTPSAVVLEVESSGVPGALVIIWDNEIAEWARPVGKLGLALNGLGEVRGWSQGLRGDVSEPLLE
jgi:hypothetical protein